MDLKQNTMRIKELSERYVFENENIPYIGILFNDSINELERAWNDRKFLIILNPHGGNGKAEEVHNGKTAIIIDLWNNCLSTIKEDPSFCDGPKDDVQVWSEINSIWIAIMRRRWDETMTTNNMKVCCSLGIDWLLLWTEIVEMELSMNFWMEF